MAQVIEFYARDLSLGRKKESDAALSKLITKYPGTRCSSSLAVASPIPPLAPVIATLYLRLPQHLHIKVDNLSSMDFTGLLARRPGVRSYAAPSCPASVR